jgi:hypothetical protein
MLAVEAFALVNFSPGLTLALDGLLHRRRRADFDAAEGGPYFSEAMAFGFSISNGGEESYA